MTSVWLSLSYFVIKIESFVCRHEKDKKNKLTGAERINEEVKMGKSFEQQVDYQKNSLAIVNPSKMKKGP